MRHPREERGIGPTRSRGSFFSPPRKTAWLASGFSPRRRAKGIQRPGVSKPRVWLSRGALRVTSAGDVLPRRQGADLSRALKDPQRCSLCLGFLPRFSATPEVSFSRGLKDHMGKSMVSHIWFLSHFCVCHMCGAFCTWTSLWGNKVKSHAPSNQSFLVGDDPFSHRKSG